MCNVYYNQWLIKKYNNEFLIKKQRKIPYISVNMIKLILRLYTVKKFYYNCDFQYCFNKIYTQIVCLHNWRVCVKNFRLVHKRIKRYYVSFFVEMLILSLHLLKGNTLSSFFFCWNII